MSLKTIYFAVQDLGAYSTETLRSAYRVAILKGHQSRPLAYIAFAENSSLPPEAEEQFMEELCDRIGLWPERFALVGKSEVDLPTEEF